MSSTWNANAQNVDLSLTMNNPHAWNLSDLPSIPQNGLNVMTTFSCGGGSSMGYKLAGCNVIAANDIDPEMAWHYKLNLKPKHYFLCPIRDLLTQPLPDELYNLDILDGSPPCSTFSTVGSREAGWGKEKHFREGQAKQVLSDLFFDYLDLVEHLKPKVAIAENVKGMLIGNAKGYTKMVMQRFREIGYRPQLFLVNAADCGVPQRRERVFFCAIRDDIEAPSLKINSMSQWITAGETVSDLNELTPDEIEETAPTGVENRFWQFTLPGNDYSDACFQITGKASLFGHRKLSAYETSPTLTSNPSLFTHWNKMRKLSYREWKRLGSFPDDYQVKTPRIGKYMIGMSVPPKMAKTVACAVIEQWLSSKDQVNAPQTA